jgi:serine/threonine-protein kinase
VHAGATVTLTVASGRVPLPDVTGRSQDDAVDALRAAGFDVRVELEYTDGAPGRVLSQSPDEGVREAGRRVVLAVSQAIPAPEPEPALPPATAPSASPTPGPA